MSFLTCFWLLPQKEHLSRSPPSPMRATRSPSPRQRPRGTEDAGLAGPCRCPGMTVPPTSASVAVLLRRTALGLGVSRPVVTLRHPSGRVLSPTRPNDSGDRRQLAALDDLVDQAVLHRVGRGEDLVALDVLADLLLRPAGVPGQHRLEERAHPQDLPRLDLDVGALATALAIGLVDEDAGVGQREPLALRARAEKDGRGGRRLTETDRLDLRTDELHRVV